MQEWFKMTQDWQKSSKNVTRITRICKNDQVYFVLEIQNGYTQHVHHMYIQQIILYFTCSMPTPISQSLMNKKNSLIFNDCLNIFVFIYDSKTNLASAVVAVGSDLNYPLSMYFMFIPCYIWVFSSVKMNNYKWDDSSKTEGHLVKKWIISSLRKKFQQ